MKNIYPCTLLFTAACWAALEIFALSGYKYYILAALFLSLLAACCLQKRAQLLCVGVFFILLGLLAGSNAPPVAAWQLADVFGRDVSVVGTLEPLSVRRSGDGTSFILHCEKLAVAGRLIDYHQKLRVYTKKALTAVSGRVQAEGRLREPAVFYNPGTLDMARQNRINGIGGRLNAVAVEQKDRSRSYADYPALLSLALRQKIQGMPGRQGQLLAGMLFGGSEVEEETRELFAANGLSHLLSVSGTHLVLLGGFLNLLFGPLPAGMRKTLIFALLFFYAAMCGFRPPVLRALIMHSALLFGSDAHRGNIFCLSVLFMLLFRPLWLGDIGFQLSFAAAAGLLWLLPRLKSMAEEYLPAPAAEGIAVTLAAQLAALPLLAAYFHQFSLIALLSNLLLAPVLELAALLALAGALPCLPDALGLVLLKLAGFLAQQILRQASWLAAIPGGILTLGVLPLWCSAAYYTLLALVLDLPCVCFSDNKARRTLIAALLCALSVYWGWSKYGPQPLTVYFLDVGQGDCAVILTPERQTAVIDTGGLRGYDTGSRIVAPFLRSLGRDRVDLLLLSHGDYDHVGGAASLARCLPVQKLILPSLNAEEERQRQLGKIAAATRERALAGSVYNLGGADLEILAAPTGAAGNEASIVAALRSPQGRALFTGDTDAAGEEKLLLAGLEDCEVLKAAHHGSRYSNSSEFLGRLSPRLAVISAGRGNTYGHPHEETLERFAEAGSTILRTDRLGAVKVVFDAERTTWYSYRYQKESF